MKRSFTREKLARFFPYALALTGLVLVLESAALVWFRETWLDEVFMLWKSLLLLRGEAVPFNDLIIEYPPLFIPIYGSIELMFGPSVLAARVLSAVILLGTLAGLFVVARRMAGRFAGLIALALAAGNLLLIGNFITSTFYSLSALLMTCLLLVESSALGRSRKALFGGIILGLLMLTRSNMVVAVLVYYAYLTVIRVPWWIRVRSALAAVGITILGYLPIVWSNPSLALPFILFPFGVFGPLRALPSATKTSVDIAKVIEVLVAFLREYYGYLLLFGASLVAALHERRASLSAFLGRADAYVLASALSIALIASHFLYWRVLSHVYYANYFMLIVILSAAVGCVRFVPKNTFAYACVSLILALNFATNFYRVDVLSDPREETDLARVERGADFLRMNTPPGSTIVSFDNSVYHIFLADREAFRPLINRNFLFVSSADTEMIRGLGMYNLTIMREWLEEADYLAVHEERWPSSFIQNPFWGSSPTLLQDLEKLGVFVEENYLLVGRVRNVYPRKYTEGNDGGTLLLYKRVKNGTDGASTTKP